MPIDHLDTSASWVTNEETARSAIRLIKEYGVDSISVSISPYHNEYIPLDRVLTLMQVCEELSITATFWLDKFLPDMTVFDTALPHLDDMPTYPTTRIPHMSRSCAELGKRSHYHIDCFSSCIPPRLSRSCSPHGCFGHGA